MKCARRSKAVNMARASRKLELWPVRAKVVKRRDSSQKIVNVESKVVNVLRGKPKKLEYGSRVCENLKLWSVRATVLECDAWADFKSYECGPCE